MLGTFPFRRRSWLARKALLGLVALAPAALAAVAPAASAKEPLSITPTSPSGSPARPAPAAPTTGAPITGAPTIDEVNTYLNRLTQLTGNFTQIGPDGKRTGGKLYVVRPGKLRFEYDPPSPLEIVADGTSVILRDRKLATQDLYSLSQTPLKFLLARHIDLRRDVSVKSAKLEGDNYVVVIDDKSTFGGTSRIALTFDAKVTRLKQWMVTDPQGYDTTVILSNLDTASRPDDKLFTINYQRVL